jgi:lipoprotein-releasing system permease protein
VTPFILKQVMLTTPNSAQGVVLRGVDPLREGKVTALAQNLVSGNLEDWKAHSGQTASG